MAKAKVFFTCSNCGHTEPKWLGRCPECGEWNSFQQSQPAQPGGMRQPAQRPFAVPLTSVETTDAGRYDSNIAEVNRVLGGGIVKGSSILIGGEPGIGKSTLMLQIAGKINTKGRILYISGEESAGQIKLRSQRIGVHNSRLEILTSTDLATVLSVIESVHPILIIVDSIQTIHSQELGAVPGTVNQIKYSAQEIISWVREREAAVLFVAHVTKEGYIAGPKVMEHMVDTVIYFDEAESSIRYLRPTKNRFGAVDEIGLFRMQEQGLTEVKDPSSLFMIHRDGALPSGLAVAAVYEGSRILMVELQALTVPAKGSISRVFSDRIDSNRVSRTAAVLEKHIGLRFSDHDIYVNVAGGIKLSEVGIELPLAIALYSARTGIALPPKTALAGELSLAGEIRPIAHLKRRIKTSREMGFSRFLGPVATQDMEHPEETTQGAVSQEEPAQGAGRQTAQEASLQAATIGEAIQFLFKGRA